MLLLSLSLSSNLILSDIKMTQVVILTQVVIKHVISFFPDMISNNELVNFFSSSLAVSWVSEPKFKPEPRVGQARTRRNRVPSHKLQIFRVWNKNCCPNPKVGSCPNPRDWIGLDCPTCPETQTLRPTLLFSSIESSKMDLLTNNLTLTKLT
jgi:hypothetical protein